MKLNETLAAYKACLSWLETLSWESVNWVTAIGGALSRLLLRPPPFVLVLISCHVSNLLGLNVTWSWELISTLPIWSCDWIFSILNKSLSFLRLAPPCKTWSSFLNGCIEDRPFAWLLIYLLSSNLLTCPIFICPLKSKFWLLYFSPSPICYFAPLELGECFLAPTWKFETS